MQAEHLERIVRPLLDWYHKNKRKLPWREDKDPYHIWVSEIMLQQTRVETVIPYFERFMERLPTIASLAACDDEELFKLWEGLGYYSRARNLRAAAQVICKDHGGRFPDRPEEIRKLPGVGPYTAGAVASIAFEQAKAAVDGNVLRVVARLTQDDRDIMDAKYRSDITQRLERIYPSKERGDLTQSLMELGAVVCVPNKEPKCRECPLNAMCGAYGNGTQLCYPVKKKKAPRRIEDKTVLVLSFQGRTAIRRRDGQGVLSGMWELPNRDGILSEPEIREWMAEEKLVLKELSRPAGSRKMIKHIFTHIEWHMACWCAECLSVEDSCGLTWATPGQLETKIALPTAFKKVWLAGH